MQDLFDSSPSTSPGAKPERKRRKWITILLVVIIFLLLGVIGYLAWQLKLCQDEHTRANADKQSLQTKVNDLTKQLDEAKKNSGTVATDESCSEQKVISAELKENIAAAITSKNTAALEGYMADKVNVVFAASEKGGDVTPEQAVTDMDYLNSNATAPWDFNLPAATLNGFKAGFYKQYFEGVTYVGQSANKYVVSFGFDVCGKINRIFVSASAELLT